MKIRTFLFSCIVLFATPLYARDKSDVIVMNNGDRLTGEIKGLDSGVLYVSFDYILGRSSVNWSKVRHLESKQQFIVKVEDGSVYSGTLSAISSTGTTRDARPLRSSPVPPRFQFGLGGLLPSMFSS